MTIARLADYDPIKARQIYNEMTLSQIAEMHAIRNLDHSPDSDDKED